MRFSIEKTVLEQALNYLITKPYQEVAQIIANIQKDIKQIEEQSHQRAESTEQ